MVTKLFLAKTGSKKCYKYCYKQNYFLYKILHEIYCFNDFINVKW